MRRSINQFNQTASAFRLATKRVHAILATPVFFGRRMADLPHGAIAFFPLREATFCCGLAGIVSYKKLEASVRPPSISSLTEELSAITAHQLETAGKDLQARYLGGQEAVDAMWRAALHLKADESFMALFADEKMVAEVISLSESLARFISEEEAAFQSRMGHMTPPDIDLVTGRLALLKDIGWCLEKEVTGNVRQVAHLITRSVAAGQDSTALIFKKINAVLKSIDHLEVRGRDSAGITVMLHFDRSEFERYRKTLSQETLLGQLKERANQLVLDNTGISIHDTDLEGGGQRVAFAITYKVAAEIGSLGDNVAFLRSQIRNDALLQIAATFDSSSCTVSAHTRWASVGAITAANCHPVDNETDGSDKSGLLHVCLNGDIDNYQALKGAYEDRFGPIQKEITTDTKIIALQVEGYLRSGHPIGEAFLMAVNDFEGSHAISMVTDLAPGKLFLAQKGSGQAIFVGLAEDHYVPVSEVYGFIEETQRYIKMDGETVFTTDSGKTQGQVFLLDGNSEGGLSGITAFHYDGTPFELSDSDVKHTELTSRDIDRQDYPHYFLKEISESPRSVERTIRNRWKYTDESKASIVTTLDESVLPEAIGKALAEKKIRRIFFIGQGTAGVAAMACADILSHYLDDSAIQISPLKASELSGFILKETDDANALADTLVIAISQSGTTTDTNRTVDMVKERGARTLAIVNRRDSDLTFKVDGVLYTSSGRDIEMSVASTKAFYSQIIAGALLGLHMAALTGRRPPRFIAEEVERLLAMPDVMRRVLELAPAIERSARRLAVTKTYWAAVGSGPNKASADEIRIKLSELCYKTISSDFIEDKKHIDLSSEPLIIICAAGTRGTVIGDVIKDTAIFHAHKATPVVIADEGENRFDRYAADVFKVPRVEQHLAPIVNTLVGHIWGYYAALAINEGSRFMYRHRDELQNAVDDFAKKGLNLYEVVLEKGFREKVAQFYNEFRTLRQENRFSTSLGFNAASDLTLLLKYLAGRLPVSEFELDFGKKGTPLNMLDTLFSSIAGSINTLARPVDAIKHQAKTVTVGTSRISDTVEGILFTSLADHGINISQLTHTNVLVLKNLQGIVSHIKGAVLYRVAGLNLLGEPAKTTTIEVMKKGGNLAGVPSRVEKDNQLKGTKHIIVKEGNVYIGKGRKDGRSILVIPVIASGGKKSSVIELILSLNVAFKEERIPLFVKIKALGGKYDRIRNTVLETSVSWDDKLLELIPIQDLFGDSAEKIGDFIEANADRKQQKKA